MDSTQKKKLFENKEHKLKKKKNRNKNVEYLLLFSWNIIGRVTHLLIHSAINSTVTQLNGNISFAISSHLFTHVKYICFWTGLGDSRKG